MNIGLISIDSHNFPSLPLMKLSAWHKKQGDNVEWYNPFTHYDLVYKSKVFANTADYLYPINADKVIQGGTGYAIHGAGGEHYCKADDKPLTDEIEHIYPDYDLYGIKDTAYGFLTRGCPRGCDFCIVGKKEGLCSSKVADLSEFWNGQKNIVLCDPNILACREWRDLLGQLEDSKALIDLNQGLDARMLTPEMLSWTLGATVGIKYSKQFALNKQAQKVKYVATDIVAEEPETPSGGGDNNGGGNNGGGNGGGNNNPPGELEG